ncbi:hypothetical protein CJD36_008795 [Flavipsychrobacter stenotrophus]|uniref:HTH cro/C1-type domain-containing protein n=1 Tax=Flavipsychrobacter stenotrophus TaxID=2077091 RepID=A0A2S7SY87_9BACT|nr:XRE family transcriptional regulator [Flavipsychrobacter stenotrophus]PQJ11882.1 hypothetical protein CJD36_008795 [Flavipsychrobacter stenotrophus]
MAEPTLIKIEPSILVWARTSLGLTVDEVAKKMGKRVEQILAWEKGEEIPTYVQLEKLAYEVYKRPLAIFFMQQAPNDESLKRDFRTLSTQDIESIPADVRYVVRKVKSHQMSLEELFSSDNPYDIQGLTKKFKFDIGERDKNKVKQIRELLKLDDGIRATNSQDEFFTFCRNALAKSGVFVFQYPFGEISIRGFCLHHEEFPAIVANSKDTSAAKLFTIFHELCHLLCDGGDVFFESKNKQAVAQSQKIEQFCNWFAAELLLPDTLVADNNVLIKVIHNTREIPEVELNNFAKGFKVSSEVLLRKLVSLGYVDPEYYSYMRDIWTDRWKKHQNDKKESAKKGGPTHFTTRVSQMGKPYVQTVLDSYFGGKIGVYEAADYLNTKIKNISGFSDLIYRQ